MGRTVDRVTTPDAWYLKHGTTGAALRRALVGRRLVGTRRIGKLLLLDVDSGAVVGVRFGMTGTLLVDGTPGAAGLQYSPRRHDPGWERFRVRFEDRRHPDHPGPPPARRAGLPEALQALAIGPLSQARWLTTPTRVFEYRSPLELLKSGEIDRVVREARGVGATAG